MATRANKRKAHEPFEDPSKKLCVEAPVHTPPKEDNVENEAEDKSDVGDDNSSEGGIGTETPLTPFSPASTPAPVRKKFPSELKNIKCTFPGCDKSFNRPVRLEAHIRTHTDDRACKCPYPDCEKAYYEEKHLQQHIKGSHKTERTYVCDREGCGKSFLTGTRLRRHIDSHKGFDRFRCSDYPGCNKAFRKHQTLQRHIRSDHLKLAPYICSHIDPVTKIQCGAGYDGAVGLRKHVEKEHTPSKYVCTSCADSNSFNSDGTPKNLGFSTDLQLQNHIRKEHADCLFCDMQFSGRRELQAHIDSQHSGKSIEERRIYGCPRGGCNKSFTTSSNLASHIRGAHEGRRFVCGTFDVSYNRGLSIFDPKDGCGKTLASKANLEDHIRTAHLGLASELNANRVAATYDASSDSNSAYASDDQSGSDSDSGYQLLEYKPKPQATRKSRRHAANIIDQLVGNVQASDPRRTLACPARGCDHRFIRQYDLDNHMFSVHPAPPFPPFPQSPDLTTVSFDQQFAPQDHFWIGDTSPVNTSGSQVWRRDEVEMRRLIDEEHIDPALVGL